ncbi:MAG: DEAD/DEAH box helicase [Spirochaetaceae bacterium]|nr:DEAD/DEAH box helicase [Spirochaetaceae bacterium]
MAGVFHPLIESWFAEQYGAPTAVQKEAWPRILAGEHVLALAPTGSGKTLTAFLAALSRFADGSYPAGCLSALYVSPLKALNEDIRRNLLEPLESLEAWFSAHGASFPRVRVETRSGDTPPAARRRFLDTPPEILAVTPESLAILLLNPRGRAALSTVRYLVLDEVHAELGSKRGAFLVCQVDRLARHAGEFQRVGLSATVNPPGAAAELVGGLEAVDGERGLWRERPVTIVSPAAEKRITLVVDFPSPAGDEGETPPGPGDAGDAAAMVDRYGKRYTALVNTIRARIRENRTVLVFTDSRQRAERIALLINRDTDGEPLAWAHHGSLSREIRSAVEKRLAGGTLPCVVATSSLELGIDIGSADEVILAGTPASAASAIQRIGRSGHQAGAESRGRIIPFHGLDLLQAAAAVGAVREREIEPARPVKNPLDLLAQVILELCVEQSWHRDALYRTLRGFVVFRTLTRAAFDQTIKMLTGYYAESRVRELKNRLYRDGDMLEAAPGVQLLLYTSGGVIANRGYYSLRLADGTKIGELDEEFVWERRLGDRFEFGNQSWIIAAIGAEAVTAVPSPLREEAVPFYHAEAVFRSPVLARRMLEILAAFDRAENTRPGSALTGNGGNGDGGGWITLPDAPECFSREAAGVLSAYLLGQKEAQQGAPLPGPRHIPVEIITDPLLRPGAVPVILHTFRGGAVNHPLAMALSQLLENDAGTRIESAVDDNAIMIMIPAPSDEGPEALLRRALEQLAGNTRGENLFRRRLVSSGIFGAAFREAAERSLLLPKTSPGKRLPLWITRERSRRLFDAVLGFDDFPAVAEAWRECLEDRFDLAAFAALLNDTVSGAVTFSFFTRRAPSPFAREILWKDTSRLMYQYDERPDLQNAADGGRVSLADRIIREALDGKTERPRLDAAQVRDFCARLRREKEGWAPHDEKSLWEWVRERIAIPLDEWETLSAFFPPELREALARDESLGGRIQVIRRAGAAIASVVHREEAVSWAGEALAFLGPWLRFEGPLLPDRIGAIFGTAPPPLADALHALEETGDLISGLAIYGDTIPGDAIPGDAIPGEKSGAGHLVCDRENFEMLLRLARKQARPHTPERPPALIVPFLARRQGLLHGETAGFPWERLRLFTAPLSLWESDIFPAREPGYDGAALDRELGRGNLLWFAAGRERVGFANSDELDLIFSPEAGATPEKGAFAGLLASGFLDIPRDFPEIRDQLALDTRAALEIFWEAVWAGLIAADSFEPLRRGVEHGFVPPDLREAISRSARRGRRHIPRALRSGPRAGRLVPGRWYALARDEGLEMDSLDAEELNRDRVRLLLDRWGVLARPFLERETSALSWSALLPTLRRMELAGEVAVGRYFGGINSLQFARPGVEQELEAAGDERGVYWMNAVDSASPAGLDIEIADAAAPHGRLPARTPASRLCFRGAELAAAARRGGQELDLFVPPHDGDMPAILDFLVRARQGRITVEKINGENALKSPWAAALRDAGFLPDRNGLVHYPGNAAGSRRG